MKVFFLLLLLILFSCQNKREENQSSKKTETSSEITKGTDTVKRVQIKLVTHKPCSFEISLPENFELIKMYEDDSPDYCDYEVQTNIPGIKLEIHSMLTSRYGVSDLDELYDANIKNADYEVLGSKKLEDGFYISGKDKNVYWYSLTKIGNQFISNFYLEYTADAEKDADALIAALYTLFKSD